jgi:hypothetical protein
MSSANTKAANFLWIIYSLDESIGVVEMHMQEAYGSLDRTKASYKIIRHSVMEKSNLVSSSSSSLEQQHVNALFESTISIKSCPVSVCRLC